MRKWIIILIPLCFGYQSIAAQDLVSCTQLLEDAKEAYAAGMVELVPDLLLPCIESGNLTGNPRQEAYKLLINAYLFDYLPVEADSLMGNFVNEFPEYRAETSDPSEFVVLLETKLRARGIDPNQAIITKEELKVPEERTSQVDDRSRYRAPFIYGNSMGFLLGGNATLPWIVERYSIGDPALDEGSFGIMPGFQLGATMNLLLNQGIETSFGLQYNLTRYSYAASPLPYSTYDYQESQHHLQLPASMIFKLNPESTGTSVYLRFGIIADYLLAVSGEGTRSYTESLKDVVVDKTNIADSRARLNLLGMAGFGIRIPFEKAFMFLETGFTSSIFLVNRAENRYDSQDLIWLLYHVDSDFRSHQLSFSAGMAWNL